MPTDDSILTAVKKANEDIEMMKSLTADVIIRPLIASSSSLTISKRLERPGQYVYILTRALRPFGLRGHKYVDTKRLITGIIIDGYSS